MKKSIFIALISLLSTNISIHALYDSIGIVTGNLKIDSTWEPKVYASVIPSFDEMFTMSNKMIVAESPIDSLGRFYFNIGLFIEEESLLRMHIVKKGNPATSLIIGGKEENHFFFIANSQSKINIKNFEKDGVFSGVIISGSPGTAEFNRITELSEYPDLLDYESTLLEKEFVEKVVNDRLRYLADNCENSLLSLYAIYKSDFEANHHENTEFYKSYLKKWSNNESTYFRSFRKQLPVDNNKLEYWLILSLIVLSGVGLGLYLRINKKRKLKKLSVQERKIFALLKQGATNQEISDECHIEISTVKSHVSSIFSKLKIRSRKEILNMK